jgi:hypothetical protein
VTGPLGVVVEDAIYGGYLVTLIDRSYPHPATERLACNPKELLRLEEMDTIHASPQDIATAVEVGWLEPGAEFYGCQFRS